MKKPEPKFPIDETVQRRLNALERLIDAEYGGSSSRFEEKTGIKMAQVNQWFSGYRALRDKALKRLEEKTKKKKGWFDTILIDEVHLSVGASPTGATNNTLVPSIALGMTATPSNNQSITLADTLERLGEFVASSDDLTRDQLKPLFNRMLDEPKRSPEIIKRIESVISSSGAGSAGSVVGNKEMPEFLKR